MTLKKLSAGTHFSFRCALNSAVIAAALVSSLTLVSCKDDGSASKKESLRFSRSAVNYEGQGQFRAAILEAKNAIQKDPKNAQGYVLLADIYNKVGAYAASQKLLETVVKKMPETSLALAESYVQSKKYRSAINILSEYNPSAASADDLARKQSLLVRSHINLGDKSAYETSLAELKKIAGKEDEAQLLEAEFLATQGRVEDAQAALDVLAAKNTTDVKALIALGNFALQRNQAEKAETYFTKALGQLPTTDMFTVERVTVLAQLSETLVRLGRSSEAYRYQKILADANPESQGAQQKFNDAMEFYRQGKFDEAKKALAEIREQYPQDKNSAMLLGLVQYQQGDNQQAIELFDKFIDPETATPTVVQAAALAKYRANQMDDAIGLLKKTVESQPDNAEIQATYGLALLDRDPTSSEGEKALEKSLAINPKQQRLRLALAKRYMALKNQPQALAQLKKAYTEDAQDLVIQQTYFKALYAFGKTDEFKQEVADYQKNYPTNPRGAFLEGWYQLTQKNYPSAQAAFEKALANKENKEKMLSYSGLAQVFELQKQPQKAIGVWQALLEEDPTQVPAYSQWLKLMQENNRLKEASAFLQDLSKKSDKWQPLVVQAQVAYAQGQLADGVKLIESALDRSNSAPQVKQIAANLYQNYGLYLSKENKPAESRTYLLKALNFFPNNMNYLVSAIELEITQKNIPEAQKLLDQFSANEDVAAEHAYMQGLIRSAEGNHEAAFQQYQQSWSKKPMDVTAETLFAMYQKNNQKEQATKFVDEWATKLPNSPRPLLVKAMDAQQKNDNAKAAELYEKTLSIAPQMVAALNNLAWIYNEQKNPKAIELGKRAYDLASNSPEVMDTYAWILVDNNRVDEGLAILEKAATLAPTNKDILEHLKVAKSRKK